MRSQYQGFCQLYLREVRERRYPCEKLEIFFASIVICFRNPHIDQQGIYKGAYMIVVGLFVQYARNKFKKMLPSWIVPYGCDLSSLE
jgi:hypothetical protein